MQRNTFSSPLTSFAVPGVITLALVLSVIPRGLAQPPLPGTFTSFDFPGTMLFFSACHNR